MPQAKRDIDKKEENKQIWTEAPRHKQRQGQMQVDRETQEKK